MAGLAVAWAIARKDLALEFRNREVVVTIAAFALLVLAVFAFSIDLNSPAARTAGPAVLWAGVAFAGVTGLQRTFAAEMERDTLDGLMLAPVSRDLVFAGKALGSFLFMSVALAVVLPVFAAMFNLPVLRLETALISVLAAAGFSTVGTLAAAMSTRVRAREVMLPMLFLPVVAPLLMAAVETTALAAAQRGWNEFGPWVGLAAGFDAVFFVVSALVFESVLEN